MKYLAGLFFSLLMAHVAHAGKLCESSCDALTISFPDGGSIEAVEALSFQFGDGGVLNDGSVTTGYSSGDLLSLAAGETLLTVHTSFSQEACAKCEPVDNG